MSDKLCWQYDRGKTYDKSDIGTSKLLADGKYRGWHYTAVINIGGNPFNYFTWHKAGLIDIITGGNTAGEHCILYVESLSAVCSDKTVFLLHNAIFW